MDLQKDLLTRPFLFNIVNPKIKAYHLFIDIYSILMSITFHQISCGALQSPVFSWILKKFRQLQNSFLKPVQNLQQKITQLNITQYKFLIKRVISNPYAVLKLFELSKYSDITINEWS